MFGVNEVILYKCTRRSNMISFRRICRWKKRIWYTYNGQVRYVCECFREYPSIIQHSAILGILGILGNPWLSLDDIIFCQKYQIFWSKYGKFYRGSDYILLPISFLPQFLALYFVKLGAKYPQKTHSLNYLIHYIKWFVISIHEANECLWTLDISEFPIILFFIHWTT